MGEEKDNGMEGELESMEDILERLGGFGRFQILILVMLLFIEIPTAMMVLIPVFIGATPPLWVCGNVSVTKFDACDCADELDPIDPHASIVAQWGLICGTAWVSDTINTVQTLGTFTGNIVTSQLPDWYGRRYCFTGFVFQMALGTVLSAAAPNPYVYLVARFICGAGFSAIVNVTVTYTMEFMTPKWRPICTALSPTGLGIMLLGGVANFFPAWRTLTWLTAAPFAAIFLIFPFLPESPRWLLSNGRVDDCLKVVKYVARVNGVDPIQRSELQQIADREKKARENTEESVIVRRFDLLLFYRDRALRKTMLSLQAIWLVWGTLYFGISYNLKNQPGDPHMNMVYMGMVEQVAYPSSLLVSNRLGRRKSLFGTLGAAAVFLAIIAILQLIVDFSSEVSLLITLCLLSRFGIAMARSLGRTLAGESFPTSVRAAGASLAMCPGSVGAAVATQLVHAGSRWPSVPFFAFAVLGIGGACAAFLLKETAGTPLQEELGKCTSSISSISGATGPSESNPIASTETEKTHL